MPIVYYTNRSLRGVAPAIDSWLGDPNKIKSIKGSQDITGAALNEVISSEVDWNIVSIMFEFSNANARDYTASIKNGVNVVEKKNDYLWFITNTTFASRITLDAGFYDGDELATELESKLDTAFSPITFTVDYNSTTANKFTIVPSSGTIKYIDLQNVLDVNYRQSIAGQLFGFTETSAFSASLGSDTEVPSLTSEVPLFTASGSTDLTVLDTEGYLLDMDQALHLTTDTESQTVSWTVNYQEV